MMKNNKYEYEKKAVIGINKIFDFIKTKDPKYLPTIKVTAKEINFYMLLSFFQRNFGYFEDILDENLKNIFEMKDYPVISSAFKFDNIKYYDYGSGIETSSKLDYHAQLKHIRNALAHNDFLIDDDGYILIDNEVYKAKIDQKWLQALLFAALSSNNNGISSGMEESMMLAFNPTISPSDEELIANIKKGLVGNLVIKLTTNNSSKLERILGIPNGLLKEFDQLYEIIGYLLQNKMSSYDEIDDEVLYMNLLNKAIKALNDEFAGCLTITKKPLKYDDIKDVINNPLFSQIESYEEKIQLLFYQSYNSDKTKIRIYYSYIKEVLYKLENNLELTALDYIYLEESIEFLINTFGILVFGNIVRQNEDFLSNNWSIYRKYSYKMSIDYGHAKKHYAELLKQLMSSLSDYKEYGDCSEFSFSELSDLIEMVNNRNKDVIENNIPIFFIKMRNIFAHGYIEVKNGIVHLFDKEPPRRFFRYSKSKKRWDEKFSKQEITYNNYIELDVFFRMLNDICSKYMLKFDRETMRYKVNDTYSGIKK